MKPKVSALELFFTFRPWAQENEPHRRLIGWDPTKMYTSIRTMAKDDLRSGHGKVEKRGRALGLVLDRRSVKPRTELSKRTYLGHRAITGASVIHECSTDQAGFQSVALSFGEGWSHCSDGQRAGTDA